MIAPIVIQAWELRPGDRPAGRAELVTDVVMGDGVVNVYLLVPSSTDGQCRVDEAVVPMYAYHELAVIR